MFDKFNSFVSKVKEEVQYEGSMLIEELKELGKCSVMAKDVLVRSFNRLVSKSNNNSD